MPDVVKKSAAEACQVTFQPVGKRVSVEAGTTLLEAASRAGLLLSAVCGGVGVCGRCRVSVVSGEISAPNAEELEFLASSSGTERDRLACEAQVTSDAVIQVPPGSFASGQRLQVESEMPLCSCDPLVEAYRVHAKPPNLQDARSDYARVADELPRADGEHWTMHPSTAAQLSNFTAESVWDCTAFTRDREIIGFAKVDSEALGLAVDLGCTKIAAYLVELKTGVQLAAAGTPNPQIPYGEDLITRLVFASKSAEGADTLAAVVRNSIAAIADQLCEQTRVARTQITDVCLVGNTAMTHLFLRLPVARLLHAPFVASIDGAIDIPAVELGWNFAPRAGVHVLPGIGGFVGADHVAMILSRGIDRSNKVKIGLDIGTNTEIVVRDPRTGKFLATSVPSGPVFEGGHIGDGMRAAAGAIEHVFTAAGKLQCRTIDDAKPVGICGSGVLDLVAELWRSGVIGERGNLSKTHPHVRKGNCGYEYVLVPAADSGHGRDIVLTQHDIGQVQLAKAAIYAGVATLLEVAEVNAASVEEIVVAGAFGSYLKLRNAVAIGLLPRLPNAEYLQVGNAAGAGAKMALLSKAERERARAIAKAATRIELKHYESFDRIMARATRFHNLNAGSY